MHIFVRRGGPNYQTGLAEMRALGEEIGIPTEVKREIAYLFLPFKYIQDKKLNTLTMPKSLLSDFSQILKSSLWKPMALGLGKLLDRNLLW